MILPLFDYSGFLLLACLKTDREDLQIIQNNALRLCLDIRLSDENVFEIPARNTRAANIRKYRTEIYKNAKYKNSPYYKAAKLWDTLPRHIRDSLTMSELKKTLKSVFSGLR